MLHRIFDIVDFFDEDTDEVLRAVKLCAEKKPQGLRALRLFA